jgi:hypothetical protein
LENFGTSVLEQLSVPLLHCFGCLQYPEIFLLLIGAKSGELDEYSISVIDFWARNCLREAPCELEQ